MRIQDQPAYILHQRPFRDTSQILELFSRDHGRLSVLSRGSRSAKSRLRGVLQAFQPLQVSWSGKGELPVLGRAELMQQRPPNMKGMALPCGFYMNELIMRLLHRHDVYEDAYDLYQQTLYALSRPDSVEIELRLFEKNLLQLLGFGLNLSEDADTGDCVDECQDYMYYIEHGPVAVRSGHVDSHHLVISGRSLQAFEQNNLSSPQARKEIKSLMRYVLSYYLGEKPLKSRELFR